MKYKKILLFLVVAFCVFFIGTNKVNAAQYTGCHYELPANSEMVEGLNLNVLFVDGKFIAGYSNRPMCTKTTNNAAEAALSENETFWGCSAGLLKDISESDFKKMVDGYSNINWNANSCPSITLVKYLKYGGGLGDFGSKKPTASSLLVGNVEDKKCYYSEDTNNSPGKHIYTFPYASNSSQIKTIGEDHWVIDNYDEDRSDGAKFLGGGGFLKNVKGKCPMYYYENSKGKYFYSNKENATSKFKEYELQCSFETDSDYKDVVNFINDHYSNGNITGTIDEQFGKELEEINTKWDKVLKKIQNENEESVCVGQIPNNLKDLNDACNNEPTCKNEATVSAAENLTNYVDIHTLLGDIDTFDIAIDSGKLECDDIFGDLSDEGSAMYVIYMIFVWVRIAVPILLIILGSVDFAKVIISQDQDALKKATSKFSKRCVVAVIIFLLPFLVQLIMGWINDYIIETDPNCVITSLEYIFRR